MFILNLLISIYFLLNVAGVFAIALWSLSNAEYDKRDILFYPLLIESLSEKINKAGVVIATSFISLFLAPAITFYFITLIFVGLIYLFCKGFIKIFERKD